MFHYLYYVGGAFLGWGLGTNDSANVFGVAVGSRMIKWRLAAILTAVFVAIGAIMQGRAGIETLADSLAKKDPGHAMAGIEDGKGGESASRARGREKPDKAHAEAWSGKTGLPAVQHPRHPHFKRAQFRNAMIMSLAAALTVACMTFLKLPVSTSQAVVGGIIGVNLVKGVVNFGGLGKVVLCWVLTPVGGLVFTLVFYHLFSRILRWWKPDVIIYDRVMTILLIVTGCYGAYALGANNVANVSAVFVMTGQMTVWQAEVFGAIAIAVGVLTYSKPVMMTVGCDICKIDAFMAFISVLSMSVSVWIFAIVGVPVSTTQAIVGSVIGFGIIKGGQTINFRTLGKIGLGWIATPLAGGLVAAAAFFVSHLHYMPGD